MKKVAITISKWTFQDFNKEEISVETKDGYLTITAEKKNEVNEDDKERELYPS